MGIAMKTTAILLSAACVVLLASCVTSAELQKRMIAPDQVVEMAKSGESADAIIQKLKAAGTVYELSATELVKLHDQGVPDAVLDYMQGTYLDAVRNDEARRAYFDRPPPYYWYGWRRYPWW
jgi:hypothetical protein